MKFRNVVSTSTVALALVAAASGAAAENVGTSQQPVVDGHAATKAEVLGTVALLASADNQPICTGTLVAPRVVVTATHCVVKDPNASSPEAVGADQLRIAAGVLDANNAPQDAIIDVERVVPHSNYPGDDGGTDPQGVGASDDIAMLILVKPASGAYVRSMPILPMNQVDAALTNGTPVTVTGYGLTGIDENASSGQLFTANTPFQRRSDAEFLAGKPGTPDSCNGDSGGPAYVTYQNTVYLVGATSRAANDSNKMCGDGGIYEVGAFPLGGVRRSLQPECLSSLQYRSFVFWFKPYPRSLYTVL